MSDARYWGMMTWIGYVGWMLCPEHLNVTESMIMIIDTSFFVMLMRSL